MISRSESGPGQATLSWTNPNYPVPISSVEIAYTKYNQPTSIDEQLVNLSGGSKTLTDADAIENLLTHGADVTYKYMLSGFHPSLNFKFRITWNYAND